MPSRLSTEPRSPATGGASSGSCATCCPPESHDGAFDVVDLPGTARAILSLSIDLVRWFSPRGSHSADDIAQLHADLAVRMTAPHS